MSEMTVGEVDKTEQLSRNVLTYTMTRKEQFNCLLCGRTGEYNSLELFYLGHTMLWLYFFL